MAEIKPADRGFVDAFVAGANLRTHGTGQGLPSIEMARGVDAVATDVPESAAALGTVLYAFGVPQALPPLAESEREQLRALGYLDDEAP